MVRTKVVQGNIVDLSVDAVINAANTSLLGGAGVDGAIHNAAGPELLEECRTLNGCKTGEAIMTKGYKLKAQYVIHTVGPVHDRKNLDQSASLLKNCYISCLELADKHRLTTLAFPSISTGLYGYPKEDAAKVARQAVIEYFTTLEYNDKQTTIETIYFVAFDIETKKLYEHYLTNPTLVSRFVATEADVTIRRATK